MFYNIRNFSLRKMILAKIFKKYMLQCFSIKCSKLLKSIISLAFS